MELTCGQLTYTVTTGKIERTTKFLTTDGLPFPNLTTQVLHRDLAHDVTVCVLPDAKLYSAQLKFGYTFQGYGDAMRRVYCRVFPRADWHPTHDHNGEISVATVDKIGRLSVSPEGHISSAE